MPLPLHGFVLAGGKSSRMGQDKALLNFQGRPLVEIAVEKLTSLCSSVSIAGNREDLIHIAPVVPEQRTNCGPAAGVEAGLRATTHEWALFIPIDVPLVPAELLRLWVEEALRVNMSVSYLGVQGKQPAFCLLQRDRQPTFSRLLDEGERRLQALLIRTAETDGHASRMYDERDLYSSDVPSEETLVHWFLNINSPEDLALAESFRGD
jgi:molybdopterin-guanine dinucleotide biosynthesis protein A